MLQYDLVNNVLENIIKGGLVEACFLKGSLARQEEDQYSNVDFYCVVSADKKDAFQKNRIKYLKPFDSIKHYWDQNNHLPKITCIYDNGMIIDLYTVQREEIINDVDIMVIYDPKEILSSYQSEGLSLNALNLGEIINEYSLNCIYFHKAYLRGDYILSFNIANTLHSCFVRLQHYYVNPKRAKLGLKQIETKLDADKSRELIALTKLIKYETALIGVKTITVAMQDAIVNLPIAETMHIDYDFFLYAKKQIFSIDEE